MSSKNCPMTESPTDRLALSRLALVVAAGLLALPVMAQRVPPVAQAEQTPAQATQTPSSQGDDPEEAGTTPPELQRQSPSAPDIWATQFESETSRAQRLYLGPLPVREPVAEPMPAARPPTSILVGPYIPEGEIALPDFEAEQDEDTSSEPARSGTPAEADAALAADISVDPLSTLDPAAVGAWSVGEGEPFPIDMWRGTSRDSLTTLIPELPMTVRSPVMRELARRLLLSPARLPGERPSQSATIDAGLPEAQEEPRPAISAPADSPWEISNELFDRLRIAQGDGAQAEGRGEPSVSSVEEFSAEPLAPPESRADMRLLTLRLERLRAGGGLRDLLALAERVPDAALTEEILRLRTDALLVLGDYDAGCSAARDGVSQSGAAYWLRALAMCEALEGNRNAVFFHLNLLDEAGEGGPGFAALVEALLSEIEGSRPAVPEDVLGSTQTLDTVLFALSRLTRTLIPRDLALSAEPLVLDALVELPDFDAETHLSIAGEALKLGLLGGDTLREIYTAMAFTEEELARAGEILEAVQAEADAPPDAEQAKAPESSEPEVADAASSIDELDETEPESPPIRGLRLDALLYQKVAAAKTPEERLRWMSDLVERARTAGRIFAVAEALSGPLSAVRVDPSLARFADTAGRIHLVVGEIDAALDWYEAARFAADEGDTVARSALIRLWPLLVVTDRSRNVPYSRRMLEQWWEGRAVLKPGERLQWGDRLFALLEELGFAVPARLRRAAMAAPQRVAPVPPSTLWRQLIMVAMDERLGEGVLTSLVSLGKAGPSRGQPAVVATAVGALEAVGLEAEARRLALESLIAAGF